MCEKSKMMGLGIYHGTVGPNDMLFMPGVWIPVERVAGADVVGVRMNWMLNPVSLCAGVSAVPRARGAPCVAVHWGAGPLPRTWGR